MSAVAKPPRRTADRVRVHLRRRPEPYAFCPNDGFFFRPLYTSGKCPLCGEAVADGSQSPPLPLLLRFDRFRFGMALLALVSVAMSTLVLVMYFAR